MELRTNEKIIIFAILTLIALLVVVVTLESGFAAAGKFILSYFNRYLVLMVITAIFFGFLAARTLQKGIAKSVTILGLSLGFLYFCRSIKLLTETGGVGRFFWYLYYPAWFGMALGFLGVVYFSETSAEETRFPTWWKFLAGISLVLSLVVLTNDYHQLMFVFLPNFEDYNNVYREGILGLQIKFFLLCEFAAGNVWLIYKAVRGSFYRVKILLPGIVLSLVYIYLIFYTFRWFNFHKSEVATVTGIGAMLYLLACIYSRVIPLNVEYEKAFASSQLGMQIFDKAGKLYYESSDAKERKENFILHSLDIKNGKVVWQEDISDLLLLEQSLKKQNIALARTEDILLQEKNIQSEAWDLKLRNSIFNEVERIIEGKRDRLVESLGLVKSNREYGIKLLKLLTGFLKKRCMLFVASKTDGMVDALELRMSMQETTVFAREAGLYTAFNYNYNAQRVNGIGAGLVYDCMEDIIWNGLKAKSDGLLITVDCGEHYVGLKCMVAANESWLKNTYADLLKMLSPNIVQYNETEDAISVSVKMGG
ncbi:MAG: hypothetical protein Q4D21_05105 [Phascolarctobacterium sp.]|nr:hypothetical protein [Phascolarctobacterium sp.]